MKLKKNTGMAKNPAQATGKKTKKRKALADMSVDDMFSMIHDDPNDEESSPAIKKGGKRAKGNKKMKKETAPEVKQKMDEVDEMEEDLEEEEDEEMAQSTKMSQKEYLNKLKKSDPDFYQTMMQSSEVMDMQSSGDEEEDSDAGEEEEDSDAGEEEEDSDDDEEEEEEEEKEEEKNVESGEESDASDAEEESLRKRGSNVVTASMIAEWEKGLQGNEPLNTFLEVSQAFLAAIQSLGSKADEEKEAASKYEVAGPQIFNAVVRLCLQNVPSAFYRILRMKNPTDDPLKCKRWDKMKNFFKSYLGNLVQLIGTVADASIAEVLLSRGVMPLLSYYAGHRNVAKKLLRKLVSLWATSEKKVRVLAFLGIFRLTRLLPESFMDGVLRRMYISFVQNSKFTSRNTWGLIDFMRMSLVELYALDHSVAYKHAFVYIRQMAIHLRNAITTKTKERVQMVYNWQYIHCLTFWGEMLSKTHPSKILQPLIYPLIQISIGTVKLRPTPAFYPLHFHVCNMLTTLSQHTETFIPVMPLLLDILSQAPLDKKHKKASIRPFDWKCMLRLSNQEMEESAFKDGIVSQVYDAMVKYLALESHSIAFPELVFPANLQIKAFLKKCHMTNFCKKMKQLLDKINENSQFIESRRRETTLSIADLKAIKDWEISVRQEGTPMSKFHSNWQKIHEKDQVRQFGNPMGTDANTLPVMRREEIEGRGKRKEVLSDDEDDEDDEESVEEMDMSRFVDKDDKKQNKNKNKNKDKNKNKEESNRVGTAKIDDNDDFDILDNAGLEEVRLMRFSDSEDEEEKDDYGV
ncbi:nucleolar complex protein 2 homolog [Penaeus chinensis]|uniref:nucleolar complex protein 2 homolog n=1 Tax=Penaeus chinensis TaxID=139456 RepID=UPI001FB6C8E5|nr:nucleolar complex protein 2 homolog [Penaeus chinensis]